MSLTRRSFLSWTVFVALLLFHSELQAGALFRRGVRVLGIECKSLARRLVDQAQTAVDQWVDPPKERHPEPETVPERAASVVKQLALSPEKEFDIFLGKIANSGWIAGDYRSPAQLKELILKRFGHEVQELSPEAKILFEQHFAQDIPAQDAPRPPNRSGTMGPAEGL